jgi:hypothetical protein
LSNAAKRPKYRKTNEIKEKQGSKMAVQRFIFEG